MRDLVDAEQILIKLLKECEWVDFWEPKGNRTNYAIVLDGNIELTDEEYKFIISLPDLFKTDFKGNLLKGI